MKLQSLRPMLWVSNVQETIQYYRETLTFTHSHFEQSVQWGYVIKDQIEIMFASLHNLSPGNESRFTGSLYLNTDNVDGWWELLKDKCSIFYPVQNFNYNMREFGIKDCNGYILQFGQEL